MARPRVEPSQEAAALTYLEKWLTFWHQSVYLRQPQIVNASLKIGAVNEKDDTLGGAVLI
jgi:hypothetical protein